MDAMTPDQRPQSRQRVLQKMRVVAMQMTPSAAYVDSHMDLDVVEDWVSRALVYRLHSHVLAEDLGTREYRVTFGEPRSWWQHFKRDVLHMRCKVRLVERTVIGHGYMGYPNAPIALPADKMGDAVVFETFELEP